MRPDDYIAAYAFGWYTHSVSGDVAIEIDTARPALCHRLANGPGFLALIAPYTIPAERGAPRLTTSFTCVSKFARRDCGARLEACAMVGLDHESRSPSIDSGLKP